MTYTAAEMKYEAAYLESAARTFAMSEREPFAKHLSKAAQMLRQAADAMEGKKE